MNNIEIHNAKLYNADCFEILPTIPDKSIDSIICDLPYGTTACKWDIILPFDKLWYEYKRVIKDNGAIVLFGSQPFTSLLICSNLEMFKYEWIWDKVAATQFLDANRKPLKQHENILVFYKKQPTYNPQKTKGQPYNKGIRGYSENMVYNRYNENLGINESGDRFPKSIVTFSNANKTNVVHPTQKPVALLEYLVKTYTNENETVLDNTMGSGTTGVACINTNRKFIGIEKEQKYFDISVSRIKEAANKTINLFNYENS